MGPFAMAQQRRRQEFVRRDTLSILDSGHLVCLAFIVCTNTDCMDCGYASKCPPS